VATGENVAAAVTPVITLAVPIIMALMIWGSFYIVFRLLIRRNRKPLKVN